MISQYFGSLFDESYVLTFFSFLLIIFQHPLMPPYGTPVPYPAVYPPRGVYAHPIMAPVISFFFPYLLPFAILYFV